MSSRTFVCFDCRTTERVPVGRWTRDCRKCRKPATYVYWKFSIPKKKDDDGWAELRRRTAEVNAVIKARQLRSLRERVERYERMLPRIRGTRLSMRLEAMREELAAFERW